MKQALNKHNIILFPLTLMILVSAGCKILKPYESPKISEERKYRDQQTTDTSSIAILPFADIFTDTILQSLIREGIANNPDLNIAYKRVQQFDASYAQSKAAFYPTMDVSAGVRESKVSEAQGFGSQNLTQYEIGVSASWEADIWGKLKSTKRARFAAYLQSDAAARAIQTSLVAGVATYYFTLLSLDQQLAITQSTVRNWDTTVSVMRALKRSARVTEAAVVQSQAQRYAAEVTIPDIKQRIRQAENALCALIGRDPGPVSRSMLGVQAEPVLLKTGIPVQLLANRPDVQAAEFAFRNAFELTNVARTAFYPSLGIAGFAGISSLTIASFFQPGSIVANIGAGLAQPLLNRKVNKTNLTISKAQQDAAAMNFSKSILTASQEVADAVSLHETALEKVAMRNNLLNALEKSVQYTEELLQNGFANYTEVITARQSLLAAQLGRVNDRYQQLQSMVNLYRALGGGWR